VSHQQALVPLGSRHKIAGTSQEKTRYFPIPKRVQVERIRSNAGITLSLIMLLALLIPAAAQAVNTRATTRPLLLGPATPAAAVHHHAITLSTL
jgi:hypothetical protein